MSDPELKAVAPARTNTVRLLLVLILALSALIQLTVVSRTSLSIVLGSDARDYFSYAYNLRNHGVYSRMDTWAKGAASHVPVPDQLRAPGYPVFLALLGNPDPHEPYLRRVRVAQAVLGVLSIWLLYGVASSFLGRRWALAPTAIATLIPHLATISTYLLTESLFYFLLLASVLATQASLKSRRVLVFVAGGTLWGLCSLVRPSVQYLPLLLLIGTVFFPHWRRFRRPAVIGFAAFALTMAPWVLRNQSETVTRTPSTLMVKTLLHGSYPDFMFEGKPESFGYPYRADPDSEARSRDMPTVISHIAQRFGEAPATYLRWYLVGKPIYFLSWGEVQGSDILIYPVDYTPYYGDMRLSAVRLLSLVLHWPLVILGLLGCLLLWLRPGWLRLEGVALASAITISVIVAYAIAIHIVAAPLPRYGTPFRPLLFALAMLPLRAAYLHWKTRRSGGSA